ncbi:hypothetical protein HY409_00285 [Candidatus Gottesmanbacteria bacterium]|nr:hypothetical protein [Candidatus Gottesmanbacteria bacterium]
MPGLLEFPPVGPNDGHDDEQTLSGFFALALHRFTGWNKPQIDRIFQELENPDCTDPRTEDVPLAIEAIQCFDAGLIPDDDQLRALSSCIGIEVTITQTPAGLLKYEFEKI